MSILTPSQQDAVRFDRHLAVTANAGSGKTTVLVQRFVDILLQTDTRINEIIAITFTEKAASELRKRISGLIGEKIRDSGNRFSSGGKNPDAKVPATLRRLEHIRDQLASANIGTIHSFCARLLREYPVEVPPNGIDAAFTVIEDLDKDLLIRESLREALEALLTNDGDPHSREDVRYALRMLGKKSVESYLATFFQKREEIERLLLEGTLDGDDTTDRWIREIETWLVLQLENNSWRECVQRLTVAATGKSVRDVKDLMLKWSDRLSPQEKISLFKDIIELVLTKDGAVRKTFIGPKTERDSYFSDEGSLSQFYSLVSDIVRASSDVRSAEAHQTLLRLTRILLAIYRKAIAIYEEKKLEQGKLDFEDLQLKALQLLRAEEIRTKLASSYKYIMVDEYQDTNRLQDEILRLLLSEFKTGNLFIVGDAKQSIYGFRHAAVEVFERTKNDLKLAGGKAGTGHITLAESFRLLMNVVDFVNRVFARTMSQGTSPFEVGYGELVNGRACPGEGNVELLLVPDQDDGAEDAEETDGGGRDSIAEECELIARRILRLAASKHTVYESGTRSGKTVETPRSFEFRDAAILLRSRTHVGRLERAMEAHGLPYVISSGIGFYQTQEILDFFNFFKFLLDTGDDVALVGILRSPFFAISDAELFEISLLKKAESFWEKTRQYAANGHPTPQIRHAVKVIEETLHLANRVPIPHLVYRVLRRTGWHGAVAGLAFGDQRRANVEKLLRFAREFEQRGLTNLFDFVERLGRLVAEEEREGQASVDQGENAVKIMTIHSAKGLEFPVVFVPFAHKKFQYDKELFFDSSLGAAFKVRAENNLDETVEPPLYTHLKRQSRLKTEAEEKRVFYVACTRARDMLVISGQLSPGLKSSSYMKWTLDGLGLDPATIIPGRVILPETRIRLLERDGSNFVPRENQHALPIDIVTAKDQIPVLSAHSQLSQQNDKIDTLLIAPLQGQTRGEFFSATQIKTFLECPAKYYLKYILGLPEKSGATYPFDENEEANDRILGELEGSLTHEVLQGLVRPDATEDDVRVRTRQLVRSTGGIEESQREKIVDGIVHNVWSFRQSAFGSSVLASPEVKTEFSISTVFGDDFLTGTIDRLYKDGKGRWCIVDYKTDRVTAGTMNEKATAYKPQLAFYALLAKKLFSQESIPSSLVFLRLPDVPVHYTFSSSELEDFHEEVGRVIGRIRARDFRRNPEMCPNCPFEENGRCLGLPS